MIQENKIHQGNFAELINEIDLDRVDFILTDPPYPDYYAEEYLYNEETIKLLEKFNCPQLVFWSAKSPFPLDYTAIHIWDKKVGCGSEYERIFERNGSIQYKMFRCYLINSTVAKNYHGLGEEFTGHPSQKPIKLIRELISRYTKEGDLVLDPFCGSGTVPLVCKQLNRRYIGIEINPEYYAKSIQRLSITTMTDFTSKSKILTLPEAKEFNRNLKDLSDDKSQISANAETSLNSDIKRNKFEGL